MLQRKIKIGYISIHDPKDRKVSSGTLYKINEALQNIGAEVIWIPVKIAFVYKLYSKICAIVSRVIRKNIDINHTIAGAFLCSKTLNKEIIKECDLLFAPFSSEALYCLKTDKPIIYLSDATFAVMVDYYLKNLAPFSIKQGNKVEQKAQDCASQIILSSNWAYNSAIKDYHQPPSKVHVIEFGANIDEKDIIDRKFKYEGHLDLLFLGVDWERKGGSIAVEACRYLNENGISATLHIVGVRNIEERTKKLPYINYIGFLNKNLPEQYQHLVDIIKKSHCLLLPTLAECAGIAFSESSANGLPIFSHQTGGVGNYVTNGRNGYLLPIGSTGTDFGKKILECLRSGELEKMSVTSKEVYNERLNWNTWSQKVENIINNIIQQIK